MLTLVHRYTNLATTGMLRLLNDHAVNVIANPTKKVSFSSLLHHAYFVVWCCFCCAGDAHIAALSQVFTHPSKTSGIYKLELRYVDVIVIIFIYMYNNGRLTVKFRK